MMPGDWGQTRGVTNRSQTLCGRWAFHGFAAWSCRTQTRITTTPYLPLLNRFRIDRIASTPQFWSSEDAHVRQTLDVVSSADVKTEVWKVGEGGQLAGLDWRVLHPRSNLPHVSDNASSLCLLIRFAGKQILLPGDLEGSGLLALVELPERPCHLLMAPHHGSLTIDPTELMQWCQPELVIISGNHRANRPEVIHKYARFGTQTGITYRDAALQYRVRADGTSSVWHWQEGRWQPWEVPTSSL